MLDAIDKMLAEGIPKDLVPNIFAMVSVLCAYVAELIDGRPCDIIEGIELMRKNEQAMHYCACQRKRCWKIAAKRGNC
jgi:hypothetical protein